MKLYEKIKKIFHNYRNIEENSIDYENAKTILKNDRNAILIDVRSPQEYKENHLKKLKVYLHIFHSFYIYHNFLLILSYK